MKNAKLLLVGVVLSALVVPASAFAAIDPADIVAEIGLYPAIVAAIGLAAITVFLSVKGIAWAKMAIGR